VWLEAFHVPAFTLGFSTSKQFRKCNKAKSIPRPFQKHLQRSQHGSSIQEWLVWDLPVIRAKNCIVKQNNGAWSHPVYQLIRHTVRIVDPPVFDIEIAHDDFVPQQKGIKTRRHALVSIRGAEEALPKGSSSLLAGLELLASITLDIHAVSCSRRNRTMAGTSIATNAMALHGMKAHTSHLPRAIMCVICLQKVLIRSLKNSKSESATISKVIGSIIQRRLICTRSQNLCAHNA